MPRKKEVEDSAENVDERVEAAANGEADGSHDHIDGRWERYLYHALGNKEYVMKGPADSPMRMCQWTLRSRQTACQVCQCKYQGGL